MNRGLTIVNFVGVVVLAALCAFQWQANRRVNLEAVRLEKLRLEQDAKLAGQTKTIQGQAADLETFREQLARLSATVSETESRLAAAGREARQLAAERDQLRASVSNWTAAVAARDERLRQVGGQLERFLQERNGAVAKFNELAAKHNATVKDLNEARARLIAPKTNTPPP